MKTCFAYEGRKKAGEKKASELEHLPVYSVYKDTYRVWSKTDLVNQVENKKDTVM